MDCEPSGKDSQVKINACERGEAECDAEEVQSFHVGKYTTQLKALQCYNRQPL
jgi:hypothetical protein